MSSARRQPPDSSGPIETPFWSRRFRGQAALAWAPAKFNLFLEVIGKRDDGYHDLESLIVAVDLFDLMEFVLIDEQGVGFHSTDPELESGPGNLIVQAALGMMVRYRPEGGVAIRLTKKIPMQAGLGGGSSDAATTLLALNDLWGIQAPRTELAEIAAILGSDVAFFLSPPAGWCTGRGETVEPEPMTGQLDLVVVKPPMGCPT